MRTSKRQRGFLTFAQNGGDDYLRMAYALALSLRATQTEPYLSVVITPGMTVPAKYREVFDEVIDVPWIDEAKDSAWKLENEWKAYHITPYVETIKLDADMLFTSDISDWWPLLGRQDMVGCTTVETYRGEVITSDFYRKCFTANDLPNLYSAFLYFRIGEQAEDFFDLAQVIYHNWRRFFGEFLEPITRPQFVSTDVVFALAAKLTEGCIWPSLPVPRFVHMKSRVMNWPEPIAADDDWLRHVPVTLTDDARLKLGRYCQYLPLHYHRKAFLTDAIIATYERCLGL